MHGTTESIAAVKFKRFVNIFVCSENMRAVLHHVWKCMHNPAPSFLHMCVRMSVRGVLACAREKREANRRANVGWMRKYKTVATAYPHTGEAHIHTIRRTWFLNAIITRDNDVHT